jgi:YesN/AraC family two-component response regulator
VDLQQPLSILLVEDDEMTSELLASMLKMKYPQAHIYTAMDGKAGLDTFRRHQPDIVITDINMPEMDGLQMLGSISAMKSDARIIVVTSHSDRQNLARIASTGTTVEVICKPINFETLFASITRYVESPS